MSDIRRNLLFIGFLLSFVNFCFSQTYTDSVVSGEIIRLDSVWISVFKNIKFYAAKPAESKSLFSSVASDSIKKNELKQALLNDLNKSSGLSFHGSASHNFDPGFDAEDNLFYRTRAQAGIDYDFLDNRFVERKKNLELINNQVKLDEIETLKKNSRIRLLMTSSELMDKLEELKKKYLDQRSALIYPSSVSVEKLSYLRVVQREDVLDLRRRLAEIEALRSLTETFSDENSGTDLLDERQLPLYDIDLNALRVSINFSEERDSLLGQIELLKKNAVQPFSLKGNVRYNYYDAEAGLSRRFLSAGVGMSVPIPFRTNSVNEIHKIKAEQYFNQSTSLKKEKNARLTLLAYDYRFKLKQAIVFEQKELQYTEMLRKENVRRTFNPADFSALRATATLDEYLKIKYELVELKQQLYVKYYEICEMIGVHDPEKFLIPVAEKKTPVNSVYIWSEVVTAEKVNVITEYLKFNRVNEAIVSTGNNNEQASNDLFRALFNEGIKTSLLIGNNKLINEDIKKFLGTKLKTINGAYLSDIHLDVEPQTAGDWKEKKELYEKSYLNMVIAASEFCKQNGFTLSLSVPFSFSEGLIKSLTNYADRIYFMAYENVGAGFIAKKVKEKTDGSIDRFVIALRTRDFENRLLMEQAFKQVSDATGIRNRAMHDLKGLFEYEEKQMNRE